MKYLNGKILLGTLLAVTGLAAVLLIGQLWFEFLAWDILIKSLVTITIIGTLAGFLVAVDYDMPASKEKKLLFSTVAMAIFSGILVIAQMWLTLLEWVTFAKILGTIIILFLLVSFVAAVKEDLGTNKKLKDDNFID